MKTTRSTSAQPTQRSAFVFRTRVLAALLGIGFAVVLVRLLQLQVLRHEHYRRLSELGGTTQRLVPGPRGAILDRHGNSLALDLPSLDLAMRADCVPLRQVRWQEVSELRARFSTRARAEKRALSAEETRALDAAREQLLPRLAREPWVGALARETRRSEAEIAVGLVEAFDRIARKWDEASDALTILRGLDETVWTRLKVRQEDRFHNPTPKKGRPTAASITYEFDEDAGESALPGLSCTHSVKRVYPHGALLAHVLGTLGELASDELDALRENGVLIDHHAERKALWDRQRAALTDAQAEALQDMLGVDPRELRDLGSLFAHLEQLDLTVRRKVAELGLADAVRWASRPARVELSEAERIALGVEEGELGLRTRRSLKDVRVGLSGVECWHNQFLRGKHGFEFDREDDPLYRPDALPRAGRVLALTISSPWQRACEQALAATGKPSAMVVLDCHTGEVLALASFPNFDPNLFSPPREGAERQAQLKALLADPAKPLFNRCIAEQYPLGSVMKALVAAVALEKGKVTSDERFVCHGHIEEGRTHFHCDSRRAHGSVNIVEALRRSCNVCFYQLGARTGVEGLAPYAKALGLGRCTGLDLPGEATGMYPDRAWRLKRFPSSPWDQSWSRGKDYHLAIGQGYMAVTPLQAAVLLAAIANGGYAVTPRLWLDGPVEARRSLGFSEATLALVRAGLDEAVNVGTPGVMGTAYRSFHQGAPLAVRVAGKTGTADTGREGTPPHAWFAGFAPSAAPQIAFSVLVEHGGHGGDVAAPVAYQVLKELYGTGQLPKRVNE